MKHTAANSTMFEFSKAVFLTDFELNPVSLGFIQIFSYFTTFIPNKVISSSPHL